MGTYSEQESEVSDEGNDKAGPKPCHLCRYFKAGESYRDHCLHPRADRSAVAGRGLTFVQREPGWWESLQWGGLCGKRGSWFEVLP